MKKLITVLVDSLMMFALVSCGAAANTSKEPLATAKNLSEVQKGVPLKAVVEVDAEQEEPYENPMSDIVLMDKDGIKITVTGVSDSKGNGAEVFLTIKNDTKSDLTFFQNIVAANGFKVDAAMVAPVPAGEEVETSLLLIESSLQACNIKTIEDVSISFRISNGSGFYDTELFQTKES